MPKRKKSNLSKKSRDAKKHKKVNTSQSEEDHNKRLQSNLIAVNKYRNGQTKEETETRLAKQIILNQLNSSQIIKEHNDHISQKKSQVSMRTRNSIKRKSETIESKSTKKRNLRQSIVEDMSTSNNGVHNETYLEDNNNISDDFGFSDIENQQPDEDNNLDFDFSLSDFETQQPHVSISFALYYV